MAIVFTCPHCKEPYKLKNELAGKSAKCRNPECRRVMIVPSPEQELYAKPALPPVDAEALAASALSDEVAAEQAAGSTIEVTCAFCDFKFYVESSREGKNTPCENPECGRIIKVPKLTAKAGDWRSEGQHRPSMAKVEQPVPEGAWDAARTGVSEEGIKEIRKSRDREETPEERRERRIKLAIYSSAMLGIIGIALFFLLRGRGDRQKESLMEKAIKEVTAAETLPQKKTFEAAILRFSAEYRARTVTSKAEFEEAKKQFGQAQKILVDLPAGNPDKELLLGELALVAVEFGGTDAQVKDQQKIAWTDVQRNIRQILDKIDTPEDEIKPGGQRQVPRQDDPWKDKNSHVKSALKLLVLRQIAPRLIERGHPELLWDAASGSFERDEHANLAGRIGLEFFYFGKRDLAEEMLAKGQALYALPTPTRASASLTALWLALNPGAPAPDKSPFWLPEAQPGISLKLENRLAYCEGWAAQGGDRIKNAMELARSGSSAVEAEKIEAMLAVAEGAIGAGKKEDAASAVEDAVARLQEIRKSKVVQPQLGEWFGYRLLQAALRAGNTGAARILIDSTENAALKAWSKLEGFRAKLADKPKVADEAWLEAPSDAAEFHPATSIGFAELARYNARNGEEKKSIIDRWLDGVARPFGWAGMTLGQLDRKK